MANLGRALSVTLLLLALLATIIANIAPAKPIIDLLEREPCVSGTMLSTSDRDRHLGTRTTSYLCATAGQVGLRVEDAPEIDWMDMLMSADTPAAGVWSLFQVFRSLTPANLSLLLDCLHHIPFLSSCTKPVVVSRSLLRPKLHTAGPQLRNTCLDHSHHDCTMTLPFPTGDSFRPVCFFASSDSSLMSPLGLGNDWAGVLGKSSSDKANPGLLHPLLSRIHLKLMQHKCLHAVTHRHKAFKAVWCLTAKPANKRKRVSVGRQTDDSVAQFKHASLAVFLVCLSFSRKQSGTPPVPD